MVLFCLFYWISIVHAGDNAPVKTQLSSFKSRGKMIRMEWYRCSGQNKGTVIFLYGSGGIENKDGYFRYFAEELARKGFRCGILHYFDRDGIRYASSQQMSQHFSDWLVTIGDAISYAQKETTNKKVALVGHSLGSQLALIQASRDASVGCVVEMSGSLVYPLKAASKLPPVFIIHGDRDNVVPLGKEKQLESALKKRNSYYEKRILSGQGHGFDWDKAIQLIDPSASFIERHL